VFLGGNIGRPVLNFIKDIQPDDWVVLELSNFQLYNLTYSPHIAVCLLIVPEHLDWHPDVEDYVEAKANLFRHQKPEDIAIYFDENEYSKKIASYSPGKKIPYYKDPGAYVREDGMVMIDGHEIIHKSEVKLLGEHNLQNICAALIAAWQVTTDAEAFKKVLLEFTGLEHRLEFVRELNGVKFYDDSFGTTPDTAIVALKALSEPKILIAGGSDKGADYNELVTAILNDNVKHVVCIGVTGYKIADLLEKRSAERCVTYTVWDKEAKPGMVEILGRAIEHTEPGDAVLLSTGSASFGLFNDYKDRGNQFKAAVL
jgi:UDP-N-acetylmuramoylalanine--D-glutamate ligase